MQQIVIFLVADDSGHIEMIVSAEAQRAPAGKGATLAAARSPAAGCYGRIADDEVL